MSANLSCSEPGWGPIGLPMKSQYLTSVLAQCPNILAWVLLQGRSVGEAAANSPSGSFSFSLPDSTLFYSLLIHLASPNSICLLFPLVMFSSHWFFSNLATDENSKEANHFHVWLTLGNNQQQRKKVMNWVITHILLLKVTQGSWKWQHPLNTYYNTPVAQERVKVPDKLTFPDGCGQRRYNIPPTSHWFWAEQPILVILFNVCDFFFSWALLKICILGFLGWSKVD